MRTQTLRILSTMSDLAICWMALLQGRCSVFWGDQIFVPSAGTNPSGAHHADILTCLGPMPTETEWSSSLLLSDVLTKYDIMHPCSVTGISIPSQI